MYKVSILVPVYNVEKYIERCARSLFEQDYQNIQYIFVDDCSPDKSIDFLKTIINEYPKRLEQVSIIRHDKNRGIAATRNTLLDNAKGEFIFFVDSDDYVEKNAISLLVNEQIKTNADIVSGNAYRYWPDHIEEMNEPNYNNKHEMLLVLIQPNFDHVLWKRIIRLSLFKNYNIRAKEGINQGDDWHIMIPATYYAQKVSKINAFIYHYDCTNINSYCSQNINKINVNSWKQDLSSLKLLENFFSDKEQVYYKATRITRLIVMNYYLHLSAKYKQKTFFKELINEINDSYKEYFPLLGFDKKILQIYLTNYTIRSNFVRIRSKVYQLIKS